MNKLAVSKLISRILPYSAMNKNANSPPPYSMLNPDTNSDSPSARSNGARFVSASALMYHMIKNGVIITTNHMLLCLFAISVRLSLYLATSTVIRTNAILTS